MANHFTYKCIETQVSIPYILYHTNSLRRNTLKVTKHLISNLKKTTAPKRNLKRINIFFY